MIFVFLNLRLILNAIQTRINNKVNNLIIRNNGAEFIK